jgi:hypothetical protein
MKVFDHVSVSRPQCDRIQVFGTGKHAAARDERSDFIKQESAVHCLSLHLRRQHLG